MLKRFVERVNGFKEDVRGSIKLLVGLSTPFLLLITGAGVDTAELYRSRVNFQNAVDAGALMAAKTLAATGSVTRASAAGEELFYGNIRNIAADVGDASITFDMGDGDCASSPVVANATLRKKVFFAFMRAATTNVSGAGGGTGLIDGRKRATEEQEMVHMTASAEVQCGSDTIEIALVLDNSGSMGSSGKIGTLRSAAADLVNTLHTTMGQQSRPDPIKFSLVPFAGMVNVGPNNRNASWMDTTGVGTYHHEYLDWDSDPNAVKVGNTYRTSSGQPLTRFTLFDQLPGISWAGCVESRPYPEHTRDTTPDVSKPETMFVPTFAPDTPDNWSGDYEQILTVSAGQEICVQFRSATYWRRGRWRTRSNRRCEVWSDGYRNTRHPQDWGYRPRWDDRIEYQRGEFIGNTGGSSSYQNGNRIYEERYYNNYLRDDHNFPASLGHPKSAENTGTGDDQYKRQRWTWKYFNNPSVRDVNNNRSGLPYVLGTAGGPNAFCTVQEITDLTTSRSAVINDIASMQARGSTNIPAGVSWGWRTLSPNEPFTNGRDYSVADNKKIMIVMTDGNNTNYPITSNSYSRRNKSYYNTWGHSENERIFDGFDAIANPSHSYTTFRMAMDEHLVETCANVKAAGISIYTIAFDVPNGSSVKTMLENCASSDIGGNKQYYDAQNNSQLVATFQSIAEQLAELAITK
ncbi:MAG: pilus assembly protein [Hyphomicrobiales bacterium]|nr:pilus assembly protein [Hyphomicrobiales bacterium]